MARTGFAAHDSRGDIPSDVTHSAASCRVSVTSPELCAPSPRFLANGGRGPPLTHESLHAAAAMRHFQNKTAELREEGSSIYTLGPNIDTSTPRNTLLAAGVPVTIDDSVKVPENPNITGAEAVSTIFEDTPYMYTGHGHGQVKQAYDLLYSLQSKSPATESTVVKRQISPPSRNPEFTVNLPTRRMSSRAVHVREEAAACRQGSCRDKKVMERPPFQTDQASIIFSILDVLHKDTAADYDRESRLQASFMS
mmetsp:Transcript_19526/g.31987  ORF Transcript_19526/g.31987 Transcript_19526/m.31987 type:complete len:252 (-) Transcript_19526:510-1265(-)|eukprot:CAMPEP_0184658496 /NCGR_PEP_ID=MMETSP0308-20130426/25609_1 /TAXON_ID=38269 /ORGANISM="Gloeochaete witrockiana, Strain SAG 46.84" /LENGTH=251 /DNA_ID=CAMNT_0027097513 /DNA_START=127 /DNA_END=882 /DNA_ORIENTATION=-